MSGLAVECPGRQPCLSRPPDDAYGDDTPECPVAFQRATEDGCCASFYKMDNQALGAACDGGEWSNRDPAACCPVNKRLVIVACKDKELLCSDNPGAEMLIDLILFH